MRVVFAILLKEGQDITVESLFAFAQVSLLQPVRCLRAINAEVEIVAIRRSWSEGAGPPVHGVGGHWGRFRRGVGRGPRGRRQRVAMALAGEVNFAGQGASGRDEGANVRFSCGR
ncbi:hypothetical protein [Streptomyces platensis]|uniref:hypothetical protein n=1 Tax=Streptomyces platensis TaxID=58346 RepID=UPI0039B75B32